MKGGKAQVASQTPPMTAWLILWEGSGEHARLENPLVDIISRHKGVLYIKEYVQRIHDLNCLTLMERAPAQRYSRPISPGYIAQVQHGCHGITIHCGHNPFLVAKPVRNLVITYDSNTDKETATWDPY